MPNWNRTAVGMKSTVPHTPGYLTHMVRSRVDDPLTLLVQKTAHVLGFVGGDPSADPQKKKLAGTVTQLRQALGENIGERDDPKIGGKIKGPWKRPIPVTVRGVFSPAVLLGSGWWERPSPAGRYWSDDAIQHWTYAGFEEWGPSWDFTGDPEEKAPYFLGQLGERDEVNSILVVVVKDRAEPIKRGVRRLLKERRTLAYSAEVAGLLCHSAYFDGRDQELSSIVDKRFQKGFGYCLLLNSPEHRIVEIDEEPDFYSGYLWQCMWAREQAKQQDYPLLKDCYFIWEHTDLTRYDTIAYNIDSLDRKVQFISERVGKLDLLQKSSSLVAGEPGLDYAEFRHVLDGARRRSK